MFLVTCFIKQNGAGNQSGALDSTGNISQMSTECFVYIAKDEKWESNETKLPK